MAGQKAQDASVRMGGSKIRPEKFQAPKKKASRKIRASVSNTHHVKLGLHSSTASSALKVSQTLRTFKQQYTFADVVTWTDARAEKYLKASGVLPGSRSERTSLCWECGGRLVACTASSSSTGASAVDVLQCRSCRTPGRHPLQLAQSTLAYTPFWRSARKSYQPQYALWLRTAFAVGVKMPQDTMLHSVPDSANSLSPDLLDRWVHEMRFALAFLHMQEQQNIKFSSEIFEMDGSKNCTHKKTSRPNFLLRRRRLRGKQSVDDRPAHKPRLGGFAKRNHKKRGTDRKVVHHGRMLFLRGRFTKASVAVPMPPKRSCAGAPSPPEDKATVMRSMRKHVDLATCVAGTDSGKALLAACRDLKVPNAAARHAHDEMSPVIRLKKSAMTEGQLATLKEASAMKKPAAIERCRDMLVVGGDNSCESEVSRVKSQMRRQNQMGRVSPMQAHIVQLAGRMLLQRPGLSTVLEAFKTYRMARQNCMGCPPDSFLVLSKDSAWLLRS